MEHLYYCRKHYHSLNVQMVIIGNPALIKIILILQFICNCMYNNNNVPTYLFQICDADCKILSVNPKFGGATHDAFIWDNSIIKNYMESLHRNNETVWLLGT